MKKITLSIVTILVIVGLIQIAPAIASEFTEVEEKEETSSTTINNIRAALNTERSNEQVDSLAKQYGVSVEGKSLDAVQSEIREKLIQEKADELGISTEGKTDAELEMEFKAAIGEFQAEEKKETMDKNDLRFKAGDREALLKEKAKELGVKTDSEDSETLQQEILDQLLKNKAKELGINIEGKDMKTIEKELKEAYENNK